MGRPPCDLDDYLEWQERLRNFEAGDLDVDVFCQREGISRSTFYRWKDRLKEGLPAEVIEREEQREPSGTAETAAFVPISLKASPVEIELPNGGVVRLPLSVGQAVLVEVIRTVGALRPWKEPRS